MPFRLYQNELYIAGLLLCITNLLFTFLQRRTDKIQNKLYILMNIVIALNAGSVVISSYAWDYKLTSEAAFFAERFAQFSYFLFHQALGPMFAFYVLYASGMEHRVTGCTPLMRTAISSGTGASIWSMGAVSFISSSVLSR